MFILFLTELFVGKINDALFILVGAVTFGLVVLFMYTFMKVVFVNENEFQLKKMFNKKIDHRIPVDTIEKIVTYTFFFSKKVTLTYSNMSRPKKVRFEVALFNRDLSQRIDEIISNCKTQDN